VTSLQRLSGNEVVHDVAFVVLALAALALFWIAARALRDAVGRYLLAHQAGADAVVLGRRVVYAAMLLLGVLIALGLAFRSSDLTIAGVILATIVASLGVQDVLKNYVSGFYVLLERHLHVGDTVEFDGHVGVIEDVRLRVTLLRGTDGSLVVVPNSELFNSTVTVKPPRSEPMKPDRRSAQGTDDDAAEGFEPV
jgi:small-conductance mechanosensitive channel